MRSSYIILRRRAGELGWSDSARLLLLFLVPTVPPGGRPPVDGVQGRRGVVLADGEKVVYSLSGASSRSPSGLVLGYCGCPCRARDLRRPALFYRAFCAPSPRPLSLVVCFRCKQQTHRSRRGQMIGRYFAPRPSAWPTRLSTRLSERSWACVTRACSLECAVARAHAGHGCSGDSVGGAPISRRIGVKGCPSCDLHCWRSSSSAPSRIGPES